MWKGFGMTDLLFLFFLFSGFVFAFVASQRLGPQRRFGDQRGCHSGGDGVVVENFFDEHQRCIS